jgi:hypothetical protein
MLQTWHTVLAQAQNGEGLKEFLQGWSGPLFLAIVGLAALAVFFTGEGASRAIRLAVLAIAGAIFIFKPEVFVSIGGAFASALGF